MSGELEKKDKAEWLCACNGFNCTLRIDIPVALAVRINTERLDLIVNECPNGPSPTDELVETGEGYKLYKEKQEA